MAWKRDERHQIHFRQWKDSLKNWRVNLLGIEDEDTGVTVDTWRIWTSHMIGGLVGLVCGFGTFVYCGQKAVLFQNAMVEYQSGVIAEPPSQLLFIMSMIWSGFASLLLSLMVCGVTHLLVGSVLTAHLDNRAEIRALSVSITAFIYVLFLFICIFGHVPVPGVESLVH